MFIIYLKQINVRNKGGIIMKIKNVKKFIRGILIVLGIIFILSLIFVKSTLSYTTKEYKTIEWPGHSKCSYQLCESGN